MTTSEQINEIATALAKAQGEMEGAKKDSTNPFFKSNYADLAAVRLACMGPLTKYEISVVQSPSTEGSVVSVKTMLLHSSGQWIRGIVSCTAKDDSAQSIGSATTYLRRYSLQSFAGVAAEDDDGEAAHGRGNGQVAKVGGAVGGGAPIGVPKPPSGYAEWLDDMAAVVDEGTEKLSLAWKNSKAEYRQYLTSNAPKQWDAMKSKAAAKTPVSA